ncbi:MAG: carbon monoxide dehydrogenase subunit G [Kiloniellales bacterium]
MKMNGEHDIPAPRQEVWQALNDTEVLKRCIPGCDEIVKRSDTELDAKVTAKVGPVQARFAGRVSLSNLDPPNSYTISGEGTSGVAGFAKGSADVSLEDRNGGTLLRYAVAATVGGKLAQVGSRLIDATANRMAEQFFSRFAEQLQPAAAVAAEAPVEAPAEAPAPGLAPAPAAAAPAAAPGGLSPVLWIGGLLIIVIILVLVFRY